MPSGPFISISALILAIATNCSSLEVLKVALSVTEPIPSRIPRLRNLKTLVISPLYWPSDLIEPFARLLVQLALDCAELELENPE
ncbi:hypothetical protein FRB99_001938, partial [Tulasnella sp. 403]